MDLIGRQVAIDAINHICPVDTEYDCTLLDRVDVRYVLSDLPSAEPWDIVKRMLNELEQKEERLYSDYCDATARLKAINKIAGSDQTPKQKVDGIKPLAELKEGE